MPIQPSLTIKLVGFNQAQTEQFSAILTLAETRLKQSWQIVKSPQADFFLCNEKHLSNLLNAGIAIERCLFYSGDHDFKNPIAVDTNQIPLLTSLVSVLNEAGVRLPPPALNLKPITTQPPAAPNLKPTATQPPVRQTPIAETAFSPSHHGLLNALLKSQSGGSIFIQTGSIGLCVDPSNNTYYCPLALTQLDPHFNADSSPQVRPINASELQAFIDKAQLIPQPLSNLIWYVTIKTSQGRLLQDSSPDDMVHLLRWPDLAMPGCGDFVKLAAFMHSNTMSLIEIAQLTAYPLEAVYDFYNACHLIGLIGKGETVQAHKKTTNPNQQSVLKKIRDRLKL